MLPVCNMSEKRPRGSPKQKEKRRENRPQASKKRLNFSVNKRSDFECSALVEFVIAKKGGQAWPFGKESEFWESAAEHIKQRTGSEK